MITELEFKKALPAKATTAFRLMVEALPTRNRCRFTPQTGPPKDGGSSALVESVVGRALTAIGFVLVCQLRTRWCASGFGR
jgi:hypothetical protein